MIPESGWITGLAISFSAGAVVGVAAASAVLSWRFRKKVSSILRIAKAREERMVGIFKDYAAATKQRKINKMKWDPDRRHQVPGPYSDC